MRVVRVLGTLEPGGAQLSVLRLSRAMRRSGVTTTLLAGDATRDGLALAARYGFPADAYRVSDAIPPDSLQWTLSADLARWLAPRLAGADLVHAHMVGGWWAAAQVMPQGVPLVASEHNELSWPCGDHTDAARQAAARVDMFFAHGPASRAWACRLGLDDGRLADGRPSVAGWRARPLPGLVSPRLTFAGRFSADKAPDLLVDAIASMRERPAAAYLIGDGPMRAAVSEQIRAAGLEAVIHLPGWCYRPGRYIAGSSVHVVPSREESWSESAVLALRMGVPVVGTAVDGLAFTLGQGRGVLVPPQDAAALAAAIGAILAGDRPDPAPGIAYARQFTPAAAARYYLSAYRDLLR